jgi:glycosyltransferase involved in cell wall biosynthesis
MFQAKSPEITLVLPAYNEQENIRSVLTDCIASLERLGRTWEILVVDNHSSDETPQVVRQLIRLEPRLRLIVHDTNRLYSGSCQTALRESRGRYVAIMDSDGQFTADDLPKFLDKLQEGANLVFGWRKQRHDSLLRKGMSLVFNTLAKFWLGFPFHDLNVGLRMFDRKFLEKAYILHAMNMANPELYARARQANLVLGEVPIQHFARTKGKTSHNLVKFVQLFLHVNRYFRDLQHEMKAADRRHAKAA